jgi:hypothetical protein
MRSWKKVTTAMSTMLRANFHKTVKTLVPLEEVHVSEGEIGARGDAFENACLIQVGVEGGYATAYLSDEQVKRLVKALNAYLEATP